MADSCNQLILDILPLPKGGARLVRVYGEAPCVTLPSALTGPKGEAMTITELGDYCFSEKPRSLPAFDALCRYSVAENGTVCLTHAFGRSLVARGAGRYDLDFGEEQAEGATLPHPICGSFLEEVTLPDSLRVIGSCAFYNCRRLARLCAGAGALTLGSDVFLNCFALETLVIRSDPEQATGLFALVNNITEAVGAVFVPDGAQEPVAGLWYPAYWEDVEECPAHILLHTFSGQGYHYRQCFLNNRLMIAEYDAIFPQGHDAEDAEIMTQLCFARLRWPWRLDASAAGHYRAFLTKNALRAVSRLLKKQDLEGLRALIALDVMDAAALSEAAALAQKADSAAAASVLADAEYAKRAAAKSTKARYDFDF